MSKSDNVRDSSSVTSSLIYFCYTNVTTEQVNTELKLAKGSKLIFIYKKISTSPAVTKMPSSGMGFVGRMFERRIS